MIQNNQATPAESMSLSEKFNSLFDYQGGDLYWKANKGRARAGSLAGVRKKSGTKSDLIYAFVQVDGKTYPAHRIVWAMFNGALPEIIDHIDGNSLNNRIENLRAATQSQNLCNRGKPKSNTSGYKGVYFDKTKNKWRAEIQKHGEVHRLGYFNAAEEAGAAYNTAAKELHGEFSCATGRSERIEAIV